MFTFPTVTPVTWGAVRGCVAPAGIVTVAGEMVALPLLAVNVTVTPPTGAPADKVTWNAIVFPTETLLLKGSEMIPLACTVMEAVALVMLAIAELAVMVVEPMATPVREMLVLVAPAAKVAVAGMVAMPVGLAAKLTTRPPTGAGADRVKLSVCGVAPISVKPPVGPKPSDAPTVTVWLSLLYPPPEAKMMAEPKATPVTCGCVVGVV